MWYHFTPVEALVLQPPVVTDGQTLNRTSENIKHRFNLTEQSLGADPPTEDKKYIIKLKQQVFSCNLLQVLHYNL